MKWKLIFALTIIFTFLVIGNVSAAAPSPNEFTSGPTDNGPVNQGENIIITGTGTSTGTAYDYTMIICDSATIGSTCTKATGIGSCDGGSIKCISPLVPSGTETSCSHNTSAESGTVQYKAYTCNKNGNTHVAVSNPFSYTVNVPDNNPPYFTSIPADANLNSGNSLGVDFDATDLIGFSSYSINWSTIFQINQSGWLKNVSALSIGTYKINVTINDTSNNLNSTIYGVSVTSDTCTPPGSGNWAIDCSDNCVWSTDLNVPGNISMTGSGTLTLNANMDLTSSNWIIFKEDGCNLVINSGGSIQ